MTKEWGKATLALWTRVHSAFRQKVQEEEADGQRKPDFLLNRYPSHPWPSTMEHPGSIAFPRGPMWCQPTLTAQGAYSPPSLVCGDTGTAHCQNLHLSHILIPQNSCHANTGRAFVHLLICSLTVHDGVAGLSGFQMTEERTK